MIYVTSLNTLYHLKRHIVNKKDVMYNAKKI